MKEPEFDKNDPLWKALDAFEGVEPHPQTRARIWSKVNAHVQDRTAAAGARHWFFRFGLPAAGFACVIVMVAISGWAVVRQNEVDREIATEMELYQNLEVIQNIGQLASYDEPDEEFDEIIE